MEKKEIVEKLEELIKKDSIEQVQDEIEQLIELFQKVSEEQSKAAEEDDDEQAEIDEVASNEAGLIENRFKELSNIYQDKLAQLEEQQKEQLSKNLEDRKSLIAELEALNHSEDHLGSLYKSFNDIQEKWKAAGATPRGTYSEIHDAYSRQIEKFHYKARISRDLRSHDHKKNYAQKVKVIEDLEELLSENSIRKLETHVKLLHVEFDQIGPVEDKEWETLKERFWTATRSIYKKVNDHYDDNRAKQTKNLKAKIEICEKITTINQEEISEWKQWNAYTGQVIQLQDDWKKIGRAAREDNDKIWRVFRKSCNVFFKNKRDFFGQIKAQENTHKEGKLALIEKVDELKDSQDWKDTTHNIIQLQKQWKEIPAAFHRDEQKLWTQFRAACNHFFDSKRKHFENLEGDQIKNLESKEKLLKELDKMKLSGNKGNDIQTLRDFSTTWQQAGFVPRKEVDRIQQAYKSALDKKYDSIKLDANEKFMLPFTNKVESWKNNPNADELKRKEKQFVRQRISEFDDEIRQYEFNMQLFSKSKGSDSLRQQVEKQIKKIERQKDQWTQKLDVLNNINKEEEE